jgi:small subunit ribosomal protein S13
MAEEKKENIAREKTKEKAEAKKFLISKEETGRIIRILQTDVPGNKGVYAGLTRIKGVSWAISNALCIKLNLDKNRKIETLSKEEIQKIEGGLKEIDKKIPKFLLNRRKDFITGKNVHVLGQNLDLTEELDIKRLKKIKSWKGMRHSLGQPTRGQSTKSHFRVNRKRGVGVKVKAKPSGGQET